MKSLNAAAARVQFFKKNKNQRRIQKKERLSFEKKYMKFQNSVFFFQKENKKNNSLRSLIFSKLLESLRE